MSNIHLISNQKRRENREISILAIVETIFFVSLTWFIAYKYDTYLHIYTSILIAPLLLLKTNFSIETAILQFLHEFNIDEDKLVESKLFGFSMVPFVLLSFWLSYFLVNNFLLNTNLFLKYFLIGLSSMGLLPIGVMIVVGIGEALGAVLTSLKLGVIVGVIAIGVMVGDINGIIGFILGLFLGFFIGAGLAFLIRALIVKFFSTLYGMTKYPIQTLRAIPQNFCEQTIINDVMYSPELLPHSYKELNFLQVSKIIEDFFSKNDYLSKFMIFFLIPIFSLAYFYRWSIKSTAWFYFPLVYISNLKILEDKENQESTIIHQSYQLLLYFNISTSILLLLYSGVSLKSIVEIFPSVQILLEVIEKIPFKIATNSIWLVVASLILYLLAYYFSSLQYHFKEQRGKEGYSRYNSAIHWIIRVKFMLWYVFFIWNLIYIINEHIIPEVVGSFN